MKQVLRLTNFLSMVSNSMDNSVSLPSLQACLMSKVSLSSRVQMKPVA